MFAQIRLYVRDVLLVRYLKVNSPQVDQAHHDDHLQYLWKVFWKVSLAPDHRHWPRINLSRTWVMYTGHACLIYIYINYHCDITPLANMHINKHVHTCIRRIKEHNIQI